MKTPPRITTAMDVEGVGSVVALYFHHIRFATERDQWTTKWANEAAAEFGTPKTPEEFAAALKAALETGVFYGIDGCRAILPDGLSQTKRK